MFASLFITEHCVIFLDLKKKLKTNALIVVSKLQCKACNKLYVGHTTYRPE